MQHTLCFHKEKRKGRLKKNPNLNGRIGYLFTDELGHPVAGLDGKVRLGVVEHDHADVAAVVLVHHAGADVDVVLPGQAGPRRNAAVRAVGNFDLSEKEIFD